MRTLALVVTVIFFELQTLILLGVLINSGFQLASGSFLLDKVYSFALILISIIFMAIINQYLIKFVKSPLSSLKLFYLKNKELIWATTLVTVLLFILQRRGVFFLLYGGHAIGNLLILSARNGFLRLVPLDILDYGAFHLAWITEWYFVYLVLGWLQDIYTRLRGKNFGRN